MYFLETIFQVLHFGPLLTGKYLPYIAGVCPFYAQKLNGLNYLTKIYLYLVLTNRIPFAMICLEE